MMGCEEERETLYSTLGLLFVNVPMLPFHFQWKGRQMETRMIISKELEKTKFDGVGGWWWWLYDMMMICWCDDMTFLPLADLTLAPRHCHITFLWEVYEFKNMLLSVWVRKWMDGDVMWWWYHDILRVYLSFAYSCAAIRYSSYGMNL